LRMKTRMALERFCRRAMSASMRAIRDATDTPSARARSRKISQNSGSRETLVACPARTTERLIMEGLAKVFLLNVDVDALMGILGVAGVPVQAECE